jgi:hypothetical protein
MSTGASGSAQLALPLGPAVNPRRRRPARSGTGTPATAAGAVTHLQVSLDLKHGMVADTPPFCRCCQRRGCVRVASVGWTACTWCQGSAVDPVAVVAWLLRRGPRGGAAAAALERLAS